MQFLNAGKHVLMEKPMTVDVAEARTLAEAATRAAPRLSFMVNNTVSRNTSVFLARTLHREARTVLGKPHQRLKVV